MSEQPETLILVEEELTMTKVTWAAGAPRPVTVEVTIVDDQGQGEFEMNSDPDGNGIPIVQQFVLEFNNNQNGVYSNGFLVTFCLPEGKGRNANWTFAPDPIWTKYLDHKGACPNNKNDNDPSILCNPTLSPDKRYLTVQNDNPNHAYFGFTLRFAAAGGGGRTLSYDPVGNNMNGGSGFNQ